MKAKARRIVCVGVFVFVGAAIAEAADVKGLVKEIFSVPSVTGNEQFLAAKIAAFLPKSPPLSTDRQAQGGASRKGTISSYCAP